LIWIKKEKAPREAGLLNRAMFPASNSTHTPSPTLGMKNVPAPSPA
jgi:hypothetical protein